MTTPVVQVVTGGTDWPAIVAAISGGVVGLAGIGSSIWVATRSISAENKRARLADKRRIYASFQASLNKLLVTIDTAQTYGTGPDRERHLSDMRAAATTMFAARSELLLIAPKDLRQLATDVTNLTARHFQAAEKGTRTIGLIGKEGRDQQLSDEGWRLSRAMRADLGMLDDDIAVPTDAPQPTHPAGPVPGGG